MKIKPHKYHIQTNERGFSCAFLCLSGSFFICQLFNLCVCTAEFKTNHLVINNQDLYNIINVGCFSWTYISWTYIAWTYIAWTYISLTYISWTYIACTYNLEWEVHLPPPWINYFTIMQNSTNHWPTLLTSAKRSKSNTFVRRMSWVHQVHMHNLWSVTNIM